ncbi:MAG: HAD family hydrolase, partial [Gaiellaceae bacterium]
DAVVTTETTERHKPHPAPVLAALEQLHASPEQAAFVGDSPFDVSAGKAAGVFTIAVLWGKLHPEERLLAAGADTIVHSPAELLDVL